MPENFVLGTRLKVHDPEGGLIAIASALREYGEGMEREDEPLFKVVTVLGTPAEKGVEQTRVS